MVFSLPFVIKGIECAVYIDVVFFVRSGKMLFGGIGNCYSLTDGKSNFFFLFQSRRLLIGEFEPVYKYDPAVPKDNIDYNFPKCQNLTY